MYHTWRQQTRGPSVKINLNFPRVQITPGTLSQTQTFLLSTFNGEVHEEVLDQTSHCTCTCCVQRFTWVHHYVPNSKSRFKNVCDHLGLSHRGNLPHALQSPFAQKCASSTSRTCVHAHVNGVRTRCKREPLPALLMIGCARPSTG